VIPGDTSNEADWLKLDELLTRTWAMPTAGVASRAVPRRGLRVQYPDGLQLGASAPARPRDRDQGHEHRQDDLGTPTPVDVNVNGKRIARGYKVWPVGVDMAKSELYGWLRMPAPEGAAPYPSGFCHFPEYGEDFFKQLTGEHLVSVVTRLGFTKREWQLIPGRENHYLDARVYARAAAALMGLDRMRPKPEHLPAPAAPPTAAPAAPTPATPEPAKQRRDGSWLGSDFRFSKNRGKGWLR
jgi:hypothetical protein